MMHRQKVELREEASAMVPGTRPPVLHLGIGLMSSSLSLICTCQQSALSMVSLAQKCHGAVVRRYEQVGNAVCPLVAAALGRCLAKAAIGASPHGFAVIPIRDKHMEQVPAFFECCITLDHLMWVAAVAYDPARICVPPCTDDT